MLFSFTISALRVQRLLSAAAVPVVMSATASFSATVTATAATAFSFVSGARLSAARVNMLHFNVLTKRASAVSVTAAKKIRQAKHKYPPIKPQIRLCLRQLSCPSHTMPFVFDMLISCFAVFANHTLILYIV